MIVGLEDYSLVYQKFGVSISEAMEMDALSFAMLLSDATRLKLKESEEGRDYLQKCWTLTQVNPDVAALRKQFT